MIILISDFDLRGSGYMHIAVSLCNELVTKHDRQVTALGIGYDYSEHNWPFSIIPVRHAEWGRHIPAMIHNFLSMAENGMWHKIEAIVVALDIPLQERMLKYDRGGLPYVGVFPVESGPLCSSWAMTIAKMNQSLVISQFGLKMMEDAGLDGGYLPIGIDTESWRMTEPKERKMIRDSLGYKDDEFIILSVADNQERKYLSLAAQMVRDLRKKGVNAKWVLVTRVDCPVGWKLDDLAFSFDITDHFTKFDKGLPFDRLWMLYASSDVFLLTSKAEGLCLPILEAMATGLPVVASHCTAIPEHIYEQPDWSRCREGSWHRGKPKGQRGFGIDIEYKTIDPWGNSVRSFASAKHGVKLLYKVYKMNPSKKEQLVKVAREYAVTRTWARAGDVLEKAIVDSIPEQKVETPYMMPPDSGLPASAPRPLPPMLEGSLGNGQVKEQDENQEA